MRTVKFIESMNIKDVPLVDPLSDQVRYYTHDQITPVYGEKEFIAADKVKERVVPVHTISHSNRKQIYIAYSKDVEDMLDMPFQLLKDSKEIAEKALAIRIKSISTASFWKRMKYAFTGNPKYI